MESNGAWLELSLGATQNNMFKLGNFPRILPPQDKTRSPICLLIYIEIQIIYTPWSRLGDPSINVSDSTLIR